MHENGHSSGPAIHRFIVTTISRSAIEWIEPGACPPRTACEMT